MSTTDTKITLTPEEADGTDFVVACAAPFQDLGPSEVREKARRLLDHRGEVWDITEEAIDRTRRAR